MPSQDWIEANRAKWKYRGQERPPFALAPHKIHIRTTSQFLVPSPVIRLRAAKISGLARQSHATLTSTRMKNTARSTRPCCHWSVPADRNSAAPITASVAAKRDETLDQITVRDHQDCYSLQSQCSPGPPIRTSRKPIEDSIK